mmetsp:Transcript_145288/g.465495  ORF Transcript_145288/g.465495 Transcript_145288/m.465495 type:complete len:244 (+) Transcript_145288:124-855(+)
MSMVVRHVLLFPRLIGLKSLRHDVMIPSRKHEHHQKRRHDDLANDHVLAHACSFSELCKPLDHRFHGHVECPIPGQCDQQAERKRDDPQNRSELLCGVCFRLVGLLLGHILRVLEVQRREVLRLRLRLDHEHFPGANALRLAARIQEVREEIQDDDQKHTEHGHHEGIDHIRELRGDRFNRREEQLHRPTRRVLQAPTHGHSQCVDDDRVDRVEIRSGLPEDKDVYRESENAAPGPGKASSYI